MSGPFAVAAVSKVMQRLLNRGITSGADELDAFGNVSVTALPPDRIVTTPTEPTQLNLFMYQALVNTAWRNVGMPSHDAAGERLTNPPLGLDLHYLLTAYGEKEFFAEALLGYGMQMLNETPVLTRDFIRETWNSPTPSDAEKALANSNLADQIELIKISPLNLNIEEISKLWTAIQAKYRPTAAYRVSVVLIEGARPARTPLPVLKRGRDDRGPVVVAPPFPSLVRAHPARAEPLPAVRLGDDLVIVGNQLNDASMVRVTHTRLPDPFDPRLPDSFALPPETERTSEELTLQIRTAIPTAPGDPNAPRTWASGFYTLVVLVRRPDLPAWPTNAISFALAPTITVERPAGAAAPLAVAAGDTVTLTCAPRIRPEQKGRVELMLGMQPVPITEIVTPADVSQPTTLRFIVPAVRAEGYVVRLRVDGVDSLPVLVTGTPPKFDFDPSQKVRIT